MSAAGYATFAGIDAGRFSNSGIIRSETESIDKGKTSYALDREKNLYFAYVSPGDLKPRAALKAEKILMSGLTMQDDSLAIVIHFSADNWALLNAKDKRVTFRVGAKDYRILSYENLGAHNVYIQIKLAKQRLGHA